MIYGIPENVGWVIVGAMAIACVWVASKLVKVGAEMYRERKEVE